MRSEILYTQDKNKHPITPPGAIPYPSSWAANTLSEADVLMSIPEPALDELNNVATSIQQQSLETVSLQPDSFDLDACWAFMTTVKKVLDQGPGIALIDRLPIDRYGRDTATGIYWLLGSLLGRPVAQNWDGLMLYDVRNTGKTHGKGVRGSVTNVELYYHTDNSYGLMPPQYIGLLCLQTAKSGGESRLVSWAEVFNRLQQENPGIVHRGFDRFLFDRQKEHAPDAPMVMSKPAFTTDGKSLSVCYSSRLMRTGYRMAEAELDENGAAFLDAVDDIVNREEMQFKMSLKRGQIQFINNSRIGHSRTAFSDHEDPDLMRHLVRLWFREHGGTAYDG